MLHKNTHLIRRWLSALLVSVFCSAPVFASNMTLTQLKGEVTEIVDNAALPSLGVAVVDQHKVLWSESFGVADLEQDRKATSDTLYRIGSISKTVTAVAVMQLVEQGALSLDANLRDIAPEVEHFNLWEQTHPVKVVHLLEHTTGWDAHLAEYAFIAGNDVAHLEALQHHPDSRTSRWPPGTRASYDNTGALVAAYLIEKVTGQRFEDYVEQNIFEPLGIEDATFLQTDAVKERGAVSYFNGAREEFLHVHTRPASSVSISANDMGKFVQIFTGRGTVAGVEILRPESVERMETATTTLGAEKGIYADFSAGLHLRGFADKGYTLYGHSGGLGGAISDFKYNKESGLGYAVMLNANDGAAYHQLNELLGEFILADLEKKTLPANRFRPSCSPSVVGIARSIL